MAQYFDFPVRITPADDNVDVISAKWCDLEQTVAISTRMKRVHFVQEEGNPVRDPIQRNCNCSLIAWRPNTNYVVSGWDDGMIHVSNTSDPIVSEDSTVHNVAITALKWNADGSRLVSADKNGVVAIWRMDGRGKLLPVCSYRKTGAVNKIAFATTITADDGSKPVEKGTSKADTAKVTSFFFAGVTGAVHYADDLGNSSDLDLNLAAAVDVLEFNPDNDRLVIITRNLLLTQVQMAADGHTDTVQKVKLSMKCEAGVQAAGWVGEHLLATSSADEPYIRVWNLAEDESYMLGIHSCDPTLSRGDRVSDFAFNTQKSVLAASTVGGTVVMWRRTGAHTNSPSDWEPLKASATSGPIMGISWGPYMRGLMCVWHDKKAEILNETELHRKVVGKMAGVQIGSTDVVIQETGGAMNTLHAGIPVRGLDLSEQTVVVWSGRRVETYNVTDHGLQTVSAFDLNSQSLALYKTSIYAAAEGALICLNLQGVRTATIPFTDGEGSATLVDVNGKFLALSTSRGMIKIYDVSRTAPKLLSSGKFEDSKSGKSFGEIRSIRCNADGSRVSILASQKISEKARVSDTRIFVYTSELDAIVFHDVGPKRIPTAHFWDNEEKKLLAVQTEKVNTVKAEHELSVKTGGGSSGASALAVLDDVPVEVTTFFATPEDGIIVQDVVPIEHPLHALLGFQVPHLHFITKSDTGVINGIEMRPLRDFLGMENPSPSMKTALIDFGYYLAVGNMDEAYKAVKTVENPVVWENMAQICVKSKRLDVAEVCFSNMNHSRGAKAVREAKTTEPELEAKVAMVGVQLGLLADAARLYQSCGRYDLLNKLYQSSGEWDKAIAVAEEHDRIHLKTTHYLYAKHLESIGDFSSAVREYELSNTHRTEVPRMLFDLRKLADLAAYIDAKDDKALLQWWAQFCESNGDFVSAVRYYNVAEDALSLVRLYCFNNDFNTAADLVLESGDRSAAYHLGRQHEARGNVKDALFFYEKSGRYNHAVRIAKEAGMDNELVTLALQSSRRVQLDVASYFESKAKYDKAVQLFHKGGNMTRALELCFKAQLFDDLRAISDDIGDTTSPEMLAKCADFFMKHKQHDKAVHLLVEAKRFEEAIDMCAQYKVKITEDMAEKMTLPKPAETDEAGNAARNTLLCRVAQLCKRQGSYHLATKKYTQAGEKLKAMKSLLRSGDTEKIIFFAGVSRHRDIYILAANYLQNLDWHTDPEIMKNIISFYTKARAYEQLTNFYEACAALEIDEYRNYEKALGALKEAAKHAAKIGGGQDKLTSLNQRIGTVERFVHARKLTKTDPTETVKICQQLLDQRDVESAIRVGDVYAVLVEYFYMQRNMEQAFRLIESMRQRGIVLAPFLDADLINTVYRAMGVEPVIEDGDEDGVGEEIDEEVE